MVRLVALFALGISAAIAVPIEPSFAPLPEVSPDVAVELIPAASLEPNAFRSQTFGITPEPLIPGPNVPSVTNEPEAVPFLGATAEPVPDMPVASAEPVGELAVSPQPNTAIVNSEPFTFNIKATVEPSSEPAVFANTGTTTPTGSTKTKPVNEGCVAIEHLQGYVLQHKQHLTRDVLCADGFCATPNHAIIVDGVTTSMKSLCSSVWKCTESVKLVNNLKVWANRRAVINDRITVTPYDVRFPKAASWVAQAAEEVYDFMSTSVVALTVVSLMVLVFGARNKSKLQ